MDRKPFRYAELHCKSNFSFLTGASHGDELVTRAQELGYCAIAITDQNSVSGVVRAHAAAKELGFPLIIGAELHFSDAPSTVVWVRDRTAYGRLTRLITLGRRRAEKGACLLSWSDLAEHAVGMLAGLSLPVDTAVHDADMTERQAFHALRHAELFGTSGYLLAPLHRGRDDNDRVSRLQSLSRRSRLPLLAAGDVLYHVPARMILHDLMTAIRHGTAVPMAPHLLLENAQHHLRPLEDLKHLYRAIPEALASTVEVADRCTFSLDELRYEYPEELAPHGHTPFEFLQQLAWSGARQRFPEIFPDKIRQQIEHELALIQDLRYEAYFLTVWDLVRFARERGILCQGRGSAANSTVCYCLGITSVDPTKTDLLFERFVSRERNEAPDIDIDFEHERREEVLQYLYEKYGRERAGLAAEVITYRQRSAIRDVGKALGLSLDRVDVLAKQVDGYAADDQFAARCEQVGIDPSSPLGQRLVYGVQELIGFPRHLSQHVGGMVMTQGPLRELVPIENAAMAGRTVISWDKNDLEELGILKVDCLALGMLTAIRKCFDLIRQYYGVGYTLENVPQDDPEVYDMICRADTMGVFQIESRAQMSMLPRLRPRCYYDLVIEVAIVRPGPIQGQMVHPYLRRRMGEEEVTYPNEAIRQVLEKTLGVPIFQEQAMKLAIVAAGFTPGEADQLRRAMGAWRKQGVIDRFRQKLLSGMAERGLSIEFAEQVFQQIRGFGEYGFPESHAASFALLVYVSAWLKYHYPVAFTAALLNSQPMGFYSPSQLLRNLHEHKGIIRPIDVNSSSWNLHLEPHVKTQAKPHQEDIAPDGESFALRLGFRLMIGFSQRHAEIIEQTRSSGPFRSMEDFAKRTRLSRSVIRQLSDADAFRSLGHSRRESLWQALAQESRPREQPLFDNLDDSDEELPLALPDMDPLEEVFRDYASTGFSLKAHPISFYRDQLNQLEVTPHAELEHLPHETPVQVAGLVVMRQRPSTAKGITFVTLEDETGIANLVVHQKTWERYYAVARKGTAWIAFGRVENRQSIVHIVVQRLEDLAERLKTLHAPARNFR